MPTLLQINSSVNVGSTGRIAEQIGQLAIAHGWKSYMAYGRVANQSASHLIRVGNKWNVLVHGIVSLLFDNHCFGSQLATRKLISKIEDIRPDIIHLHNLHGYYLNVDILFRYLEKANIPVVWTLHDCWSYTGHCSYYSNINCQKWQSECNTCPKLKNYPKSLFVDHSKTNFLRKKELFTSMDNLTIVPVSEWLGAEVKKSFLGKRQIRVITNGVDVHSFTPLTDNSRVLRKYNLNNKFILLGVATAWGPRKGWEDYIKLSQMLPNDYQIVMVGVTEKQKTSLPQNIIAINRTENIRELAELYSAANVVLSLSDQESFGLTTVEGFACGTPGIVYNCTASPELITKETGFVVERGDFAALKVATETIQANGKDYYMENCRKRALEFYDSNKQYLKYIELYNTVINN